MLTLVNEQDECVANHHGVEVRRNPAPGEAMPTHRTTMRSRSGTKLYAVRDDGGKFKDIQT